MNNLQFQAILQLELKKLGVPREKASFFAAKVPAGELCTFLLKIKNLRRKGFIKSGGAICSLLELKNYRYKSIKFDNQSNLRCNKALKFKYT